MLVILVKVIIAEKPSLARNIANAIGDFKRRDGYLENKEYLVTWAFGHLFSLYDIEEYSNDSNTKWRLDNIPCFPSEFKFSLKKDKDKKVDEGVLKQFNIIKELVNRSDVSEVINAGDADREGEIIVRLCVNNALKDKKRFTRLWLPDQTEVTVRNALSNLKEESEYDNLANEGFARTYIDWLYGVNLTRYATLKSGALLRVGRVIVPIVKAIYDRDLSIRNFVSEIYYGISSNIDEVELNSKLKFDKDSFDKASEMCKKYNECKAKVIGKSVKKDTLDAGKLYSLSTLQNVLGKRYKMPMDKSLSIVQKLYEEGYVTYPRTNSEYMASNEKDKVKNVLNVIKKLGYEVKFKDKKTIFDDSKIESHSALTPTYKVPNKNNMSSDELIVYSTILKRFVAVFSEEECKIEKSELKIKLGDLEEFSLKGNVITQKGWTKYDEYNKNDKLLPSLNKGDEFSVNFEVKEKKTSPPKHYTIETLNNYLKNPFKEDKSNLNEEDDSEDYKAMLEGLELGTEATRTGIIDNAIKSEYITLKKDVYYILKGGEYLINSLSKMNINMDKYKTSEMGKELKKVFKGNSSIDEAVNMAKSEIQEIFEVKRECLERDTDTGFYGEVVGVCPVCGSKVIRDKYGYGCLGYKEGCKFRISDYICERVISKNNVIKMLRDGSSAKIEGFTSKNGKKFDAYLVIENGKTIFKF